MTRWLGLVLGVGILAATAGAHVLRPGRYRLVGAPRGLRPLRARFRIVRR